MFSIGKCRTGIDGLDQILRGGLPEGGTTLVVGGPGTGKSLVGLEFLYRSALGGEPGIFISFEERAGALRDNARTLGWDLLALEQTGKLSLIDARIDPRGIVAGEFGIECFTTILDHKLRATGARRVVIDALDLLLRLISDHKRAQNELLALHQWLEERGITTLLTVKAPRRGGKARNHQFMDYMADCVIALDNRLLGQLSTRRLRVVKYRGSAFDANEYPFVIERPGITLLPISGFDLSHKALGEFFPSGVRGLDGLLGGGFRRAASVLISGSSGTGKTTLCSSFAQAACARNDPMLYINFEESEAALTSAMLSAGIDLGPALATGRLRMLTAMPEAMGAEQHLVRALGALKQLRPACVVVESASACRRMGTAQAAFEYLMRLINACKEMGMTILITNQTAGFMNQEEISGIGISSIIDAIVMLRLVEEGSQLQRQLLVMKSRGASNSLRYHDFRISDAGVDILGADA
ncbi:MAG: circadian clock protein KaiC [Accumulibacter sp.]|uniref:circadian clock protein KaiC n=1 Tax=Accumulibacter sp. TaxID=2053492 RepID=UPI003314DD38